MIERRWGTSINASKEQIEPNEADDFEEYQDDIEEPRIVPDIEDSVDSAR